MHIYKLALVSFLFATTGLFAQANQLKWLNGQDVCTGTWSYTTLASCAYADDPNSPIYGTTYDISYAANSCQNWSSYSVAEVTTRSTEWEDSVVVPSCGTLQPGNNSALDIWVPTGIPAVEGPWNGRCKHRNAFKKCDSWYHVRRATCTYERRVANTTENADACGTHQVSTPRSIITGYNKLTGYSRSCPGAQTQKSGYLTSKASLTDASVDTATFSCSTLDNIAATTDEHIRNKFDAYMNLAFELSAKPDLCNVKQNVANSLNTIANTPGISGTTVLTDDQFDLVFITIDSLTAGCSN